MDGPAILAGSAAVAIGIVIVWLAYGWAGTLGAVGAAIVLTAMTVTAWRRARRAGTGRG